MLSPLSQMDASELIFVGMLQDCATKLPLYQGSHLGAVVAQAISSSQPGHSNNKHVLAVLTKPQDKPRTKRGDVPQFATGMRRSLSKSAHPCHHICAHLLFGHTEDVHKKVMNP